jgi:hypothetical protein
VQEQQAKEEEELRRGREALREALAASTAIFSDGTITSPPAEGRPSTAPSLHAANRSARKKSSVSSGTPFYATGQPQERRKKPTPVRDRVVLYSTSPPQESAARVKSRRNVDEVASPELLATNAKAQVVLTEHEVARCTMPPCLLPIRVCLLARMRLRLSLDLPCQGGKQQVARAVGVL